MAEQCIRTKDMKDKNYSEQLRNNKRLESVIDEVKASKDFDVIGNSYFCPLHHRGCELLFRSKRDAKGHHISIS